MTTCTNDDFNEWQKDGHINDCDSLHQQVPVMFTIQSLVTQSIYGFTIPIATIMGTRNYNKIVSSEVVILY